MKYSILALFAFGLASLVSGEWVDPGANCNQWQAEADELECLKTVPELAIKANPAVGIITGGSGDPRGAVCDQLIDTRYPECKKLQYMIDSGDAASLEMASLKQLVALAAAVAFAARIAFLR
ncbi:hypothetical protein DdX_17404 [Ditylenchus destructor]|uniref:Uncharacterized protein n=1 Tax=Ditylenchus destructor TaxID=166010 RepID=A0AAD4MRH1_9BILA|nr:hypothetical protein DdX_17404 [Ditylenchus destructor]